MKYLAREKSQTKFYGLDLPDGQLSTKTNFSNVELSYGDYHDLNRYSDGSMDIVYAIEALCHAHDKGKVISEVYRVLRKGGCFIVIDGYFCYSKPRGELSDDQKTAIQLVTSSMMVTDKQQDYDTFRGLLKKNNFTINQSVDYSQNIMPSLYRLEHTATKFIQRPIVAKVITALVGDIVTANAVAGYLMPACVEEKLFGYFYTLAQK